MNGILLQAYSLYSVLRELRRRYSRIHTCPLPVRLVPNAVLAALLATAAAPTSAAIDTFDFLQSAAVDSSNGIGTSASTTSAVDASIIGGEREIYVNGVSGLGGANNTSAGVSDSKFSFVNGSGVSGFGALRWDGTSNTGFNTALSDFGIDRTGFAGVNLSAVGDSLKLTVARSDAAIPFTLQFFSSDTNWTSFTFSAIPVCAAGDLSCNSQAGAVVGPTNFFFNYALMNLLGTKYGTGADFSNITAVQAIYNFNAAAGSPGTAQAVDFTIDFEGTAPAGGSQAPIVAPAVSPVATAFAPPLIDSFDFLQPVPVDSSNGIGTSAATTSAVDASIVGGEREIYVNGVSGLGGVNNTSAGVGDSQFSFVNGSGVSGFGALRYDGASNTGFDTALSDFGIDRTGFAGVNFSAVGDSLKIHVERSDSAFPFTLQFFSSDTDWTTFTFSMIPVCAVGDVSCLSQAGAVAGPTDFFFNYALMNLLGTKFGAGADFSNITAFQVIYNFDRNTGTAGTAEAIDFSIDFDGGQPTQVAEPATIALFGVSLAGLGFARRRRLN